MFTIKRYWEITVKKENGCIEWTGYVAKDGYGHCGRKGKDHLAHRMSWYLTFGKIPVGMFVLHKCDNRKCVNGDHLYIGTQKDNIRDMDTRGRRGNHKGENNPQSILTAKDVINIRRLSCVLNESGLSYKELSIIFGVGYATVYAVINKKTWKYLN